VKGRDKYNKINTNISTNSIDNNSKRIYDNFIGKYLPTNNNYSSLIEMIDNTVVDAHNKNYTEFLNTKKLNDVVNNYKKNFNNLLNLVFGKESIEKFIII
jgi:CTP synthase (UTP-ammonia lyase)